MKASDMKDGELYEICETTGLGVSLYLATRGSSGLYDHVRDDPKIVIPAGGERVAVMKLPLMHKRLSLQARFLPCQKAFPGNPMPLFL